MDPIPDVSLEEQIIARAWRMGAKETVYVYRLVMKGSVEHTLMKLRNFGSLDETIVDENASTMSNEEGQIPSKTDTEYVLLNMKRVHTNALNHGIVESSPSFIKSDTFNGAKPDYIFKHGALGLGYYLEVPGKKIAGGSILKKSSFEREASGTSGAINPHTQGMADDNVVAKRDVSSICVEEKRLIELNKKFIKS